MKYEKANGEIVDLERSIIGTTWCINCEKPVYAEYVYKGDSLCPKCFKAEKEYEESVYNRG